MPENILSFVYVLIIGTAGFFFISNFAKTYSYQSELKIIRKAWYVVVPLAFLTGNFFLFLMLSTVGIFLSQKIGRNAWLIYIILGLSLPALSKIIPGFFGIESFGDMSWQNFIALIVLFPRFIQLILRSDFSFTNFKNDKLVLLFMLLIIALDFVRADSSTQSIRDLFYNFLALILPYYVISRDINSFSQIKSFFFSVITLVLISSFVSLISAVKHWQLYDSIKTSMELARNENITAYHSRGGLLRPTSVFGMIQSAMMSFAGFFMAYVSFPKMKPKEVFLLAVFILAGIISFSRGPWIAFILSSIVFFVLLGGVSKLLKFGFIIIFLILISPMSSTLISMLPFIGTSETATVDYRVELIGSSVPVILQNPFFGDKDFINNPGLQHLIQGEKIIDIVNTYLQYALEYGLIVTFIFILIFLKSFINLYSIIKTKQINNEYKRYCIAMLSILVMFFIAIATVSYKGSPFLLILIAVTTALINISRIENISKAKALNDTK